jgi:hypothetical protein
MEGVEDMTMSCCEKRGKEGEELMCPFAYSLLTQVASGYHTLKTIFFNEVDVFEC